MNIKGFFLVAASLFLASVCLVDLILCPHSKVEESFQIQATHDLFYYGIGPAWKYSFLGDHDTPLPYDHLQFPGVVPRTFLGPLILSYMCQVARLLCLPIFDIATKPMLVQFLSRFFLMGINIFGWIRLALAIDNYRGQRGRNTGSWLLVITACQFHMTFYSSRMLPNTFALAIVLQAYSFWLNQNFEWAASCLVFATTVFRCDILLLLASVGLSWLTFKQLTILRALRVGIQTGVVSLLLTVPIDSLLWRRILWPEGEVFYFNTVLGKSSEWGTSSWHWYFTSALPKSMLLTILLLPLAVLRVPEWLAAFERQTRLPSEKKTNPNTRLPLIETEWLPFLVPAIGFVGIYSCLGHKEMRFIFPALPILNLAGASTLSRLSQLSFRSKDKSPTLVGRASFACGIICLLLTLIGNLAFVAVSKWNYPGGEALMRLSQQIQEESHNQHSRDIHVYIDVASAMSGVSLFGQRAAELNTPGVKWTFEKGGYENQNSVTGMERFTHLLSESLEDSSDFVVTESILGNPRLNFRKLKIDTMPSIFVKEQKGFR